MTANYNQVQDTGVVPGVKKIAVLRANALGDFIFALPALQAVRSVYPQAEIVYLGKPWHQDFLANRPAPVDRVVVVPISHGVRIERAMRVDERELDDFFQRMQREQFDIAIQMHGGGQHSNPFALNLGAKLTVGLKTPDAPPLDRWIPYSYYQHEILRFLEVVSLIGATTQDISPVINVTEADLREAASVIGADSRPMVVLHPGASDPRRRWPTDQFAAVGEALTRQGARILITGTGEERALAEAIIAQMSAPAENLCDRLSLRGMTGLLSRAALFISNDTGPLHLAEAVGACTVGIYWCGNLINAGPITRAKHRPAISWITHCPICGTDCTTPERLPSDCDHLTSFVAGVTVDDVLNAALELLEAQKTQPGSLDPAVSPPLATDWR